MSPSRRLVGRCPVLFLLAVCFDVLGLSLILTGIFANLQLDGRSFGEFIIYSGGIMVFFSLLWWLSWYSFNLEVSMEELMRDPCGSPKRNNLVELARKFSERFSKRSRKKALAKEAFSIRATSTPNMASDSLPPTHSVFINIGFNHQLEAPSYAQKHMELSSVRSMNGHMDNLGVHSTVDRLV